MSRFAAQIAMSSDGYRWSQYEHYRPGRDDDFIFLDWAKHITIRERYKRTGEIAVNRFYDPFQEEPALYRIFAVLKPTPEAILDFVQKYGDFTTVEELLEGEEHRLSEYKREISEMRRAVEAADEFLTSKSAAKREKVPRKLLAYVNDILGSAPLYMSATAEDGEIRLRLVVTNLLHVMKLQLAEAIADRKHYRTCELCNKPFEVTPQINRSDRLFCSDNCRVKAYQRRKKQAIEMRRNGKSICDIVKATRSDLETVKRWLSTAKSQEVTDGEKKAR
jgi:hypothetical protein